MGTKHVRLIDADALMRDIEHYHLSDGKFQHWVEVQPTIEPERKKGEWIELDSDEEKYDDNKCPCCKHTFTVDAYHWTDIGFVKDDLKFCPNCGADMRGEQDENY